MASRRKIVSQVGDERINRAFQGVDAAVAAVDIDVQSHGRRISRIESARFDIRDYGATESGDVATALANAIAAASATGQAATVYVPAGSYWAGRSIRLASNVAIVGAGKVRTKLSLVAGASLFLGASVERATVADMWLAGYSGTDAHAAVWLTVESEYCQVRNCRFSSWTTAIRGHDKIRYCRFTSNILDTPVVNGTESGADRIRNAYLHIEGSSSASTDDECRQNVISENSWHGSASTNRSGSLAPRAILVTNSNSYNVISRNVIDEWEGQGIVIGGAAPSSTQVARSNVIVNNTIRGLLTGTSRGVHLFNSCVGNVVQGNSFREIAGDGIHLTEGSTDNVVQGNTLEDCGRATRDGYSSSPQGGIRIDGVLTPNYRNTIEGNLIRGCYSYGIVAENAAHSCIKNNTIVEVAVDSVTSSGHGIWLTWGNTSQNNRFIDVVGNKIVNVGGHGLLAEGRCQNLMVADLSVSNANRAAAGRVGVRLATKTVSATTEGPDSARVHTLKVVDDPAIAASSTTYAVTVDAGVNDVDCQGVQAENIVNTTPIVNGTCRHTLANDLYIRDNGSIRVIGTGALYLDSGAIMQPDGVGYALLASNYLQTLYGGIRQRDLGDTLTGIKLESDSRTSTNATPFTFTYQLPSNSAVDYEIVIVARRTGGSRGTGAVNDAAMWRRLVRAKMVGLNTGTPTILGTDTIGTDQMDADLVATGTVALTSVAAGVGGLIVVTVVGAANVNLSWAVSYRMGPENA